MGTLHKFEEYKNKNIVRELGDTIPELFKLQSQSGSVDLSEADVFFEYKENDKTIKISGVSSSYIEGDVAFYPRAEFTIDTSNGDAPYQAFQVAGSFPYKVSRNVKRYYKDDDGWFVKESGSYEFVAYDDTNPGHLEKQRYSEVVEVMTHFNGTIRVIDSLS